MATQNKGGRPPKYKSPEEMQARINYYFDEYCIGRPYVDANGEQVFDKYGFPVFVDTHRPSVTGLARVLGFESRQSLLNYQGRKEFRKIIMSAKMRIEEHYEELSQTKDGANGAIFNLRNSFKNWDADKPKPEESKAPAINIICDIPKPAVIPEMPETAADDTGLTEENTPTDEQD